MVRVESERAGCEPAGRRAVNFFVSSGVEPKLEALSTFRVHPQELQDRNCEDVDCPTQAQDEVRSARGKGGTGKES